MQALTPAAQVVFASVHGYIFVVDAARMAVETESGQEGPHTLRARMELQLLVNPVGLRNAPLLVLGCYRGNHRNRNQHFIEPLGCVKLAEALHLAALAPRAWRVEMLDVEAFGPSLTRGLQWALYYCFFL